MKTGCMLCGAPLQYFNQPRTLACAVCGERFQADAACENGHYVCDACHAASAGEAVVRACLHASERNPAKIALRIMRHPAVHMHGPEHHALTGCVLLAAYHASGGAAELETGLPEIVRRAGRIPGGSCGFMGCCGAAVGAGTYWSVAAGATPLSRGAWADCNRLTSRCLLRKSRRMAGRAAASGIRFRPARRRCVHRAANRLADGVGRFARLRIFRRKPRMPGRRLPFFRPQA